MGAHTTCRRWTARGLALALALLLPGAAAAREKQTGHVCDELAEIFFVIARYEEEGQTRELQREWVREKVGSSDSPQARTLERALDFVYSSDASPDEIRQQVRQSCRRSRDGQAVVLLPGL